MGKIYNDKDGTKCHGRPDALVESNLLICINICSGVIKGIAKCISLGTLLSIKQLILSKSKLLVFLFEFESFRISATDAKYLFSLFALLSLGYLKARFWVQHYF